MPPGISRFTQSPLLRSIRISRKSNSSFSCASGTCARMARYRLTNGISAMSNPPVHAWACWRVFKIDKRLKGKPDYGFLERCFHKLLMNFTWWVNRKDSEENNIFEGGFLGLDNIGIFDRSAPLPTGGVLRAIRWHGLDGRLLSHDACGSLSACQDQKAYEDIASKFFEHFLYIAYAVNHENGGGLWDEEDGFYYDRLRMPGWQRPADPNSLPRWPGAAVCVRHDRTGNSRQSSTDFASEWNGSFEHRPDLTGHVACMTDPGRGERRLLAIVKPDQLRRILARVFDEAEFLSPYGIRSLSRYHAEHPYTLTVDGDVSNREVRSRGIDEPACSAATRTGAAPYGFQ